MTGTVAQQKPCTTFALLPDRDVCSFEVLIDEQLATLTGGELPAEEATRRKVHFTAFDGTEPLFEDGQIKPGLASSLGSLSTA
jgi:hypothetical protein